MGQGNENRAATALRGGSVMPYFDATTAGAYDFFNSAKTSRSVA